MLVTVQAFGAVGGESVIAVTEANYLSHRIAYVYRYEGEPQPVETLGFIETKWSTTDLLMRGGWDPEGGGTWEIESDEWQVTLELAGSLTGTSWEGLPEIFYSFHLTLAKADGTWSHTFASIGDWSELEFGTPYTSYGDVILGADSTIGEPLIWEADGFEPRLSYLTSPDGVPSLSPNGGTTDVGSLGLLYDYQYTFENVLVGEDEWMAFSLGIGFSEVGYGQGDVMARIGIADELSRTVIPEPSAMTLFVGVGLGLLAARAVRPVRATAHWRGFPFAGGKTRHQGPFPQ